jgi:hypothetical protein
MADKEFRDKACHSVLVHVPLDKVEMTKPQRRAEPGVAIPGDDYQKKIDGLI